MLIFNHQKKGGRRALYHSLFEDLQLTLSCLSQNVFVFANKVLKTIVNLKKLMLC